VVGWCVEKGGEGGGGGEVIVSCKGGQRGLKYLVVRGL